MDLKSGIELMAGLPHPVVYGFFGLVLIVPLIRGNVFGGPGASMLAAIILLGIMILPTIVGVTEAAIRGVPESYYEGSLALGATKERSIYAVMLPAAKSGILAGIVLGIGRAIGETMAVVMIAGNQPRMPKGLLKGVRTMTMNIVTDMVCNRIAQTGTDRNGCCVVCIYSDHKSQSFSAEQEERK